MKSAYLYVRVSTDEQRRKGFSLIEQEDRLLKYCETNRVKIAEIFREDFSAKDFNRPEWKRLIKTIKKKNKHPDYILFIKWDRFSRNVALAYQMIKVLQDLNVQAVAIDQPVNFEIPENSVMLAIYLAIPEAENLRRGLNCSDGMRRARKLGRWPGRAPIGYVNLIGADGRGFVAPKQPEASQIKRAFEEFAKGIFSISEVRKMIMLDGLQCSRNNFWKLLHNPFYCGIITVPPNAKEELQIVTGIHEPLISEKLFYDVQIILNGRHHPKARKEDLKILFPLRGFLKCPYCHGRLTGSASKGRYAKYGYYHCTTPRCKGRFRTEALHQSYEEELSKISLRSEVHDLFKLVLEDENIFSALKGYEVEQRTLINEISKQELLMTSARKHFISGKIDADDFDDLKRECKEAIKGLNIKLSEIKRNIADCNIDERKEWSRNKFNLCHVYKNQDIGSKRYLVNLFNPSSINPATKRLERLAVNKDIYTILTYSS